MSSDDRASDPREAHEARRTAYALGQLAAAEQAIVEQGLPLDRAAIEDAKATAKLAAFVREAAAVDRPAVAPLSLRRAIDAKIDGLFAASAPKPWRATRAWWPLDRRRTRVAAAICASVAILAIPLSYAVFWWSGNRSTELTGAGLETSSGGAAATAIIGERLDENRSIATVAKAGSGDRDPARNRPGAIDRPDATSGSGSAAGGPRTTPDPDWRTAASGTSATVTAVPGGHASPAKPNAKPPRSFHAALVLVRTATKSTVAIPQGPFSNIRPPLLDPSGLSTVPALQRPETVDMPWMDPAAQAVSEIPLDIDGRSWVEVRESLRRRVLPPRESIRPEELVNYFKSGVGPVPHDAALHVWVEAAECPWNREHRLVRITLQSAGAPEAVASAAGRSPVARDVHCAAEFPPRAVERYRLVGCGDLVDARMQSAAWTGTDVPAGRAVTVLYEVAPRRVAAFADMADAGSKVARRPDRVAGGTRPIGGLMILQLNYRLAADDQPRSATYRVDDSGKRFLQASADFRFAAAVAAFGMALRRFGDPAAATLEEVQRIAESSVDSSPAGDRGELLELIRIARSLGTR